MPEAASGSQHLQSYVCPWETETRVNSLRSGESSCLGKKAPTGHRAVVEKAAYPARTVSAEKRMRTGYVQGEKPREGRKSSARRLGTRGPHACGAGHL